MCIQTRRNFPHPLPLKTGWPWTENSRSLDMVNLESQSWPKISIVTPNLNQGQYIEETIRSVLLQGYPNLEYIVIDGGSDDRSVEIIQKYNKWIKYWVSESDRGQAHALNKGFEVASGQIFAYINSDDLYTPYSFKKVATEYNQRKGPVLIAGECEVFENNIVKRVFKPSWPIELSYFLSKTYSSTFAQPSSFWDSNSYKKLGGFDESLHYCFDREFFFRLGQLGIRPLLIDQVLSRFREHSNSKTIAHAEGFHVESIQILEKHSKSLGIQIWQKKKWKKRMENEIEYSKVFRTWKEFGRIKAINAFTKMILKTPSMLFERKILGQARRLFTFKEKNVIELNL